MPMRGAARAIIGAGFSAALTLGVLGATASSTEEPLLVGACYCRAEDGLHCLGVLTKPECDKRCSEALCDDWFWLERRACWNWGYGG